MNYSLCCDPNSIIINNLDLLNTRNTQNGRNYESDSSNYLKFNERAFKKFKMQCNHIKRKGFCFKLIYKSGKKKRNLNFRILE